MTEICGVALTDGWRAFFIVGGPLVALLGLGAWSAEQVQRRYERVKTHRIIRTRLNLPAEPIEEVEDD